MQTMTIDHEEIRLWIENQRGKPAIIDNPEAKAEPVGIRINFPGNTDEALLGDVHTTRNISWEEFFDIFDREKLIFVYENNLVGDDPTRWYHFENRGSIQMKQ